MRFFDGALTDTHVMHTSGATTLAELSFVRWEADYPPGQEPEEQDEGQFTPQSFVHMSRLRELKTLVLPNLKSVHRSVG